MRKWMWLAVLCFAVPTVWGQTPDASASRTKGTIKSTNSDNRTKGAIKDVNADDKKGGGAADCDDSNPEPVSATASVQHQNVKSPRDAASGQASGKRQGKPAADTDSDGDGTLEPAAKGTNPLYEDKGKTNTNPLAETRRTHVMPHVLETKGGKAASTPQVSEAGGSGQTHVHGDPHVDQKDGKAKPCTDARPAPREAVLGTPLKK